MEYAYKLFQPSAGPKLKLAALNMPTSFKIKLICLATMLVACSTPTPFDQTQTFPEAIPATAIKSLPTLTITPILDLATSAATGVDVGATILRVAANVSFLAKANC